MKFTFDINNCQWYFESLLENKGHVKTILEALQLSLFLVLFVQCWVSDVIALLLHAIALHYHRKSILLQDLDKHRVNNFGFMDY